MNLRLSWDTKSPHGISDFWFVLLVVIFQLIIAYILDSAATYDKLYAFIPALLILLALFFHFIRFIIGGWIHKNYDLSKSYPLTALFYPMIYLLSMLKGEAVISIQKVCGILLIVTGIVLFQKNKNRPCLMAMDI